MLINTSNYCPRNHIPSSLNLCQHAISTTSQPIEPSTTIAPPGVLATIPPQEDCSYCPECARPFYEQIGGSGSFAEIEKVTFLLLKIKITL